MKSLTKQGIVLGIMVATFGGVLIVLLVLVLANDKPSTVPQVPGNLAVAIVTPSPTRNSELATVLAAKQAEKDAGLTRSARLALTPSIPPREASLTKLAMLPTDGPTSTPFIGIDNSRANTDWFPRVNGYFIRLNSWKDKVNGKWMEVWAGKREKDTEPAQGIIFVVEGNMWENGDKRMEYLTPTKAGGVRIKSVVNFKFTLESETGVTFFFDLPSRTFVTS